MQIKVFRAASMKEAMTEVKETLGDDAVILHTKKTKGGGIFGYGSKDIFEVTAAVDEESQDNFDNNINSQQSFSANVSSNLPAFQPPKTVLSKYKTNGTTEGLLQAENNAPAQKEKTNNINNTFIPMQKEDILHKSRIIKAEDFINSQNEDNTNEFAKETEKVIENNYQKREQDAKKIEKLEAELAEVKTLLANFMRKESADTLLSLQEAMENHDVEKNILNAMVVASGAGETLSDAASPEAKYTLTAFLEKKLKYTDGIEFNEKHKGTKIVALIGPTGVGKTTTLAKIAAELVLNQNVKAALITADTYRISAVEQLRTYSDIIGLPLDIVYNQEELKTAIKKHEDKELILIDTAGRSQHNEYQLDELKDLLKASSKIEKHLVLSATTKEKDAKNIIERFSFCNPKRIIFTKVDETSSLGMILNLLYEKDMAISYLTNGQAVPDDIMVANADTLASLFLRN